jgi:hypothetical protein
MIGLIIKAGNPLYYGNIGRNKGSDRFVLLDLAGFGTSHGVPIGFIIELIFLHSHVSRKFLPFIIELPELIA